MGTAPPPRRTPGQGAVPKASPLKALNPRGPRPALEALVVGEQRFPTDESRFGMRSSRRVPVAAFPTVSRAKIGVQGTWACRRLGAHVLR
eukprot:5662977-Prymnesium_polylepis.1